ncbi:MAG: hypothetical protein ACO3A2_06495 [Bdellovibrionia bacterium]
MSSHTSLTFMKKLTLVTSTLLLSGLTLALATHEDPTLDSHPQRAETLEATQEEPPRASSHTCLSEKGLSASNDDPADSHCLDQNSDPEPKNGTTEPSMLSSSLSQHRAHSSSE